MKISLLHYSAPPVVGGVESVIWHHARKMSSAGHNVQIIAGRGAQVDEQVPFVSLPLVGSRDPQVNSLKADLNAGRIPEAFAEQVDQILDALLATVSDSDWLIAHNVCSLNKNLALTAALKRLSEYRDSPRLILWHHDLAWTTPRYRNELHPGYPWDLLRSDWPEAVQVTISAQRQRELADLLGVPEHRIRVVPNGVDTHHFLKLEKITHRFIDQMDLLEAFPLLLLPARITPRKNIEFALRVLSFLRNSYPRARLVITGPLGPHNPANIRYFDSLANLRSELHLGGAVHFLAELDSGFLPDAVISDFYALADALFFPSREEGFGIPILEAGLAGIPVFCADIPPLREIADGLAEFFAPDGDPEAVARNIAAAITQNRTLALREHVRRHFTWEQIYTLCIEPLLYI